MSKFYEITDTILLLANGRKVSFLQIYHHAGAIICCWAGVVYRPPPSIVGLLLNAGVHTLMVRSSSHRRRCYLSMADLRTDDVA